MLIMRQMAPPGRASLLHPHNLTALQAASRIWTFEAWQGHCGATEGGSGCSERALKAGRGHFSLLENEVQSWEKAAAACWAHIALCAPASFMTLSLRERDCSWAVDCTAVSHGPHQPFPDTGFRTGPASPFSAGTSAQREWEQDPSQMREAALAVGVCNGTDHKGLPPEGQLLRAKVLACSVRNTTLPLLALAVGLSSQATIELQRAGYEVLDITHRQHLTLHQFTAKDPLRRWPRNDSPGNLHQRGAGSKAHQPGRCEITKLHAWRLLRFKQILLVDSDVIFLEDPAPWMQYHRDEYFLAQHEWFSHQPDSFEGLNSHMVLLRPNMDLARMVNGPVRIKYTPFCLKYPPEISA